MIIAKYQDSVNYMHLENDVSKQMTLCVLILCTIPTTGINALLAVIEKRIINHQALPPSNP